MAVPLFNKKTLNITNSTLTGNTVTSHGGAVYNENSGTSTIQYNRITGNTAPDIYNNGGSVNANYNWWGTNFTTNPTSSGRINSGTSSIWMVLTITANPSTIGTGGSSTITADLLHDNQGTLHNPANGLVPYTGLVKLHHVPGKHK